MVLLVSKAMVPSSCVNEDGTDITTLAFARLTEGRHRGSNVWFEYMRGCQANLKSSADGDLENNRAWPRSRKKEGLISHGKKLAGESSGRRWAPGGVCVCGSDTVGL